MTQLYVVNKKFEAEGESLLPGDVVDVSTWRWFKNLLNFRYIYEAPQSVTEVSRVPREEVAKEKKPTIAPKAESPVKDTKPKGESAPKRRKATATKRNLISA